MTIPLWKKILIPDYDETTLFLISYSIILLLLVDPTFRFRIQNTFTTQAPIFTLLILIFLLLGIILSLVHVFIEKRKTKVEKEFMLLFGIVAVFVSGIYAWLHVMKSMNFFWMILPVWNIFNSIILITLLRTEMKEDKSISEEDATLLDVMISVVFCTGIIFYSRYNLWNPWSVTFTMALFYATTLNNVMLHSLRIKKRFYTE